MLPGWMPGGQGMAGCESGQITSLMRKQDSAGMGSIRVLGKGLEKLRQQGNLQGTPSCPCIFCLLWVFPLQSTCVTFSHSLSIGVRTSSGTQRTTQSPRRRITRSLEGFLPHSFTPPHQKPPLERYEICSLLHRDLLSPVIVQDCFVLDYGNVEGTYSKNVSEIVYGSKIHTAISFML